MADLDHLETPMMPPAPRSTEHWRLPQSLEIQGDGLIPHKMKMLDADTGEEIKLPLSKLTMVIEAGVPNRVEIVLAGVAVRSQVHFVAYSIEEGDLRELARQNGFEIAPVPVYGARISSYGPAEHAFTVRDLPGWQFVADGARPTHASLDAAGTALRRHLDDTYVDEAMDLPTPSELQDGEFELMAHYPRSNYEA